MGVFDSIRSAIRSITKMGDSYFYSLWESGASWSKLTTFEQKIRTILENPAALYIFLLLPEIFSMGEYELKTKDGKEVEDHPLLDFLKSPNPMQTEEQFKWDYMFWRKMGTANIYIDSKIPSDGNVMYFLNGDNIEWPQWIKDRRSNLFLSKVALEELDKQELKYKTRNQNVPFRYEQLLQFFDISNGLGDWFGSPSRVDALYKIIANSDESLKSKNINSKFSGKFIVSGKVDVSNTSKLMMGDDDKQSVRNAMNGREQIFPTKSSVDINRFVDTGVILKELDSAWMNDAFILGKMLNIPKDVIEMLGDSTYENQEKARASLVYYCIQPDANDFCAGILRYFGLDKTHRLSLDYSHLPFVQVFEKDKADTWKVKAEAFMKFTDAGAKPEEVAAMLDVGDWLTGFNPPNQRAQGNTEGSKLHKVS